MWIAISNAIGSRQPVGGGAPPDPGYTPPLDTYTGATAAYSVRKLSSTYSGPCIEAYRVSDGATQDIGFDSDGLIDTAAISTFGGASVVGVRTWYDQSGNALDAVQTTAADMPQIYDGFAIETNGGKPAIRTIRVSNSVGDHLASAATTWMDSSLEYACLTVWQASAANNGDTWVWDSSGGGTNKAPSVKSVSSQGFQFQALGTTNAIINIPLSGQAIRSAYLTSGTLEAFYNATSEGTATAAGTYNANIERYIGSRWGANEGFNNGYFQELIWYAFDQSSNGRALESNINDYFQITNLPASSSGLLYDYPDAKAAYSVRRLSNNAIKCMRVRQSIPPYDELDIGFTATGDLDEQAIIDFGGANPLTVSKWYDQSGQSNHATQITPSSQPSIYDGSAVLTENGKPSLKFAGSEGLRYSGNLGITGNSNRTFFSVQQVAVGAGRIFDLSDGTTAASRQHYAIFIDSTSQLSYRFNGGFQIFSSTNATQQYLFSGYHDGPNMNDGFFFKDGSALTQSSASTLAMATSDTQLDIGGLNPNAQNVTGTIQELLFYASDQSSNRTAIEYNVGDYYGIDVLPLDTYTTANAAYSFRKLRTAYAGSAVRVRRDVAPFDEQDIGFDSYGNLDLAALDTFSGGDRLRVSVWYDQTTGGWDASNVTYAKQPLIHDGTSVVTLNGSPAMDYEEDVTSRSLNTANGVISATASPLWVFVVGGINAGFTISYPKITGPSVPMGVVGTTTNFFSVWRGTQVFWGPGNGAPAGDQYIRTETATGTAMNGYLNGVLLANNKTIGTGNFSTNLQFGGGGGYAHKIQEYIIFEDNMTADRASIENMINSHYGTY